MPRARSHVRAAVNLAPAGPRSRPGGVLAAAAKRACRSTSPIGETILVRAAADRVGRSHAALSV